VLDHVLDKGIVIDAWVKVQLVGIDLLTVEARVLVASIETYLQQAEAVSQVGPFAAGQFASINPSSGMLRNIDGYLKPNRNTHLKPKIASQKKKIDSHLKLSPKPSHAPKRHRH
jgi:gas vesicle protein GvpA/GvpJ/GvpM family